MEDLVSIIVPVYNVETYLPRCLDSIAAQTLENFEVILVDDGSTDGSGMICENYCLLDSRFRLIRQKNKGLSEARNTALATASGKFVCFVDADDYIHPRFIEILHDGISNGADVSIADFSRVDVKGNVTPCSCGKPLSGPISGEECIKEMLLGEDYSRYLFGVVWNKLYRRDVLDGIRFYDIYSWEDAPFNMRVYLRCANVGLVNEVLYYYVNRSGSILSESENRREAYAYGRTLGLVRMIADVPKTNKVVRDILSRRVYCGLMLSYCKVLERTRLWRSYRVLLKRLLWETWKGYLSQSGISLFEKTYYLLRLTLIALTGRSLNPQVNK